MTTKKKLTQKRLSLEAERQEYEVPMPDPTQRPRWRRHTRQMQAMLRGIDPARFEELARRG